MSSDDAMVLYDPFVADIVTSFVSGVGGAAWIADVTINAERAMPSFILQVSPLSYEKMFFIG
jgi:hypothetical protein